VLNGIKKKLTVPVHTLARAENTKKKCTEKVAAGSRVILVAPTKKLELRHMRDFLIFFGAHHFITPHNGGRGGTPEFSSHENFLG
jgi:hypothetical protein